MGVFTFPTKPDGDISNLWMWVMRLVQQLEKVIGPGTTLRSVSVSTTETAVAHGQNYIPSICIPVRRTNVAVWQSKQPDAKFCYFTAAGPSVIDVKVCR